MWRRSAVGPTSLTRYNIFILFLKIFLLSKFLSSKILTLQNSFTPEPLSVVILWPSLYPESVLERRLYKSENFTFGSLTV